MKSFMKYCLRYSHLLTKFGQQAELLGEDSEELDLLSKVCDDSSCRLGHLHTEAGKTPPKTGQEGNIVAIEDTIQAM